MTWIRPLVLTVALATAGAALMVPTTSIAQTAPALEPGVVAILPVPSAVGDPKQAVDVHVVAFAQGGLPMAGLKLKPSASVGTASGWTEVAPGMYRFTYKPPRTATPTEVTLSVKGKLPPKSSIDVSHSFTVTPQVGSSLTGSSNPPQMTLGKDEQATLSITGAPDHGGLMVQASSGEVSNLTKMGGGKYTARFGGPEVNFPHISIVTMAHEVDPLNHWGYTVVELQGAVDYPVEASPNSTVLLRIKDREFGPVQATPEGSAQVSIVVPPGVSEATVVSVVDGESTEKVIDLRVPETKRMALIPLPKAIPADSKTTLPIRVVLLDGTGAPDTNGKLVLTASTGEIGEAKHEGSGIYVAQYTAPDLDERGEVTIDVGVEGSKVQEESVSMTLLPRRVTRVQATTDPEVVTEDTDFFTVNLEALGSNGDPIAGATVSAEIQGGSARGPVEDAGEGRYRLEVRRDGGLAVVDLALTTEVSDNPVAHVVVLPQAERVDADGVSGTDVAIVTTDLFGHPVAGVAVDLSVDGGGAKLPAKVKTGDNGVARVQLTSGSDDAMVVIRATADGRTGAGAVLQGAEAAGDVYIDISAQSDLYALYDAWGRALPTVRRLPEAAPPAPLVLAAADAETHELEVSYTPEVVGPGAVVTVRAVARTEDGKAIPGKSLDVLTSAGTLGPTVETAGAYETELTLGEDAEGEIKVSVIDPAGPLKLVRIAVDPSAAVAAAPVVVPEAAEPTEDASADAEEEEPASAKEPKEPKAPRDSQAGDYRWLRARVSGVGALYRYNQSPSEEPGPLLPSTLSVGDVSRPATPVGGEVHVRAWMPDLPYVGGVVSVRSSYYAIASSAFNGEAPDWLYDVNAMVTARYPYEVGGDQFWVGGKAGFHYDDFMVFTGCLQPGCVVSFDPLSMPGLGLGAELGAELDTLYFIGGYTHGLANFIMPYSSTVDANLGLEVIENGFVDLGFSWVARSILLQGVDSGMERGQLTDGQVIFKLGAGIAL